VVRERSPELEATATVATNYGREGLLESILKALRAAGKDPERLAADDLVLFERNLEDRRITVVEAVFERRRTS
jgi:hypothetical protein